MFEARLGLTYQRVSAEPFVGRATKITKRLSPERLMRSIYQYCRDFTVSLLSLAIVGEGLFVLIALVWARWRETMFVLGGVVEGLVLGLIGAAGLGAANYYLLWGAPDLAGVRSIRRLYAEDFKPIFGDLSVLAITIISLSAGIGEELLFRGVLQTEMGLLPASIIFGLLHTGGTGTLAFGCWVMLMGGALGGLAIWTGGLMAPIVAHAVYDAAAMNYVRWGRKCGTVEGPKSSV
jgi:membrane protease YdiL (CAAX protease family)